MTYHKMGLPIDDCKWLARVLVNMEYKMITVHGPSEASSSTTNGKPILGIGQGATDASAGWLLITTLLTKMYDKSARGYTAVSPCGALSFTWTHTMFVDDAYLIHASDKADTQTSNLKQTIQQDLNEWNKGLESTWECINGDKTNYVILKWLFQDDGKPYLDTTISLQNTVKLNTTNTATHIKQLAPDHDIKQFKSLGVRTPPTLQDHYELDHILCKSKNFAKFLVSCPLTRKETWVAYTMYFVPSYTYSAVTLSLPMKNITRVHQIFMPLLLNKLGIQSTFPRAIAFAPRHIGGIGITPFNVVILQRKINFLYCHLRANTELGKVILINILWAQIQAGRANPILTSDDCIDYIENKWIIHLHNELKQMAGKLLISNLPSGKYMRANDVYLMDAWDKENLSTDTLQKLNYCRMYLQITRLSDIVTNDGHHIQAGYLQGTLVNQYSTHTWPKQQKPSSNVCKLWKNKLYQTFYRGY